MSSVMPELRLLPVGAAFHTVVSAMHQRCFDDGWTVYTVGQVMRMAGAFGYVAVLRGDENRARTILGKDDDEETPVGFALACGTGDEWELLSIGVLRDHRRLGTAKRLMRAVIDGAIERGADRLFLEVAEDNDSARALYDAFGFVQIGRRAGYYKRLDGPAVTAITMRLDLDGRRGLLPPGLVPPEMP
ncbi:MAG TPA: N-acetyltransferase [Alphaproteobacteria bacterium]|jgi:ribosomal-protein-alanine N-acetyltransferase